ncbi:hypothetical protein [Chroococcidiopsis sp.]|uniref:hypothetical protein n=1 Tax=Chroococcidiopsis sp. TaxID=3088168 RepID=UPI003F413042
MESNLSEVEQLRVDFEELRTEMKDVNDKVEIYKNAMGQVVNLAFALIGSATVTVLVSNVLSK